MDRPVEAAILRDALAAHKVENVMLVSAFLAAAALAQSVGSAVGYAHTGCCSSNPTLRRWQSLTPPTARSSTCAAAVQSADAVDELTDLVAQFDALESPPDGVFLVGAGVDITSIKPCVESATTLPVTVPEEPETALARGAALASAHAPLFVSSTAAVAYSQVPDWTTAGWSMRLRPAPAPVTQVLTPSTTRPTATTRKIPRRRTRPQTVPGGPGVMTVFFVGVSALVISLGLRLAPR
ncbi:hypothetical protein I553_9953 [Mycobacterium xenopi 4042]|uniref:DUF7159 domain-containing protein n=1 Tax=Mycobacterium xenopi 4042 TaxID=1299334 RepID=X7YQ32_MYCXE|nr:hypothetical protein I553_9953 [Mycobacterium xenopi 4042]